MKSEKGKCPNCNHDHYQRSQHARSRREPSQRDPRSLGDHNYANIRNILGGLVGLTVVDISQHDQEDFERDGSGFIVMLFSDGSAVRFYDVPALMIDGPAAAACDPADERVRRVAREEMTLEQARARARVARGARNKKR